MVFAKAGADFSDPADQRRRLGPKDGDFCRVGLRAAQQGYITGSSFGPCRHHGLQLRRQGAQPRRFGLRRRQLVGQAADPLRGQLPILPHGKAGLLAILFNGKACRPLVFAEFRQPLLQPFRGRTGRFEFGVELILQESGGISPGNSLREFGRCSFVANADNGAASHAINLHIGAQHADHLIEARLKISGPLGLAERDQATHSLREGRRRIEKVLIGHQVFGARHRRCHAAGAQHFDLVEHLGFHINTAGQGSTIARRLFQITIKQHLPCRHVIAWRQRQVEHRQQQCHGHA